MNHPLKGLTPEEAAGLIGLIAIGAVIGVVGSWLVRWVL